MPTFLSPNPLKPSFSSACPGLCAVNPEKPLQYGEMAYPSPRGDVLTKEYVDQWLHLIKERRVPAHRQSLVEVVRIVVPTARQKL